MKRLLFLGLPAMLLSFSAAKSPTYNHFNLAKLSDGVWAALHKSPGGHAICNAGIVDMGDKTLVIDPFMNLDAAEELKGAAIQLTGREPSIVINTHFHNDHIRGNQLFPGAIIISTVWARGEMERMEPLELKWEKENAPAILAAYQQQASSAQGLIKKELPLWIDYFEGMIKSAPLLKTTLPTVTFNDSLWLYGTKRHIKLVEYDNGHTKSDAAVMLPEEKIVFTGDLLFNQAHPWLSDGNPTQWKTYLDQWKSDPSLSTFIPGHGEPGDRKSVEAMSNYIKDLQELVARQKMKGTPDSVIIQSTIPAPYADWMFGSRFFEANLSFLCRKK